MKFIGLTRRGKGLALPADMTTLRRNSMFLSAALFATVAACHQAKPATPMTEASYEAQQPAADRSAEQDRAARDLPGYAPSAKPAPAVSSAPRAWPAPAPQPVAESTDDPMREFDMP
jgi:hypothetical protein